MNEPQETTPLLKGKPARLHHVADAIERYNTDELMKMQNITVEIDGEYYQASLAVTNEDDILDKGHLVIKPIL